MTIVSQVSSCGCGTDKKKTSGSALERFANTLNLSISTHSYNSSDPSPTSESQQSVHPKVVEEFPEPVDLKQPDAYAYENVDVVLVDLLCAVRECFRSFLKQIDTAEDSIIEDKFNQEIQEIWKDLQTIDRLDEDTYLKQYAHAGHSPSFLRNRYKLVCILQKNM